MRGRYVYEPIEEKKFSPLIASRLLKFTVNCINTMPTGIPMSTR